MAIKLQVEKLDDIEETIRPLYVEKEGKFRLDLEGYEDVAPVKAALSKANRDAAERRKQVERWEKLGKSPEEIEEALAEHAELKEKFEAGHKPEDLDVIRKQAAENAAKEAAKSIKKAQDEAATIAKERDDIRTQYERSTVDQVVTAAISEHKGRVKALKPIVQLYVKPTHEEGRLRVRVYDEAGEIRYNSKGDPMTPSELVAEMSQQDDYASLFEGSGTSGGGAKPAGTAKPALAPLGIKSKKDFGTGMEGARKISAFIEAFPTPEAGTKAYEALPDA